MYFQYHNLLAEAMACLMKDCLEVNKTSLNLTNTDIPFSSWKNSKTILHYCWKHPWSTLFILFKILVYTWQPHGQRGATSYSLHFYQDSQSYQETAWCCPLVLEGGTVTKNLSNNLLQLHKQESAMAYPHCFRGNKLLDLDRIGDSLLVGKDWTVPLFQSRELPLV